MPNANVDLDEISYTLTPDGAKVYLGKKLIGNIEQKAEGWQYTPKGQKNGGEYFSSFSLCQRSLEED